jgi:hypothetical protein
MARIALVAGTAALIAALLSVAPAWAAPATVSGTVEAGTSKLPRSARTGEAQVVAMNLETGAIGDAATVDRRGRYRLQLPAGKWALRTSVVALGKPFVSFLSAVIATRSGQRRSLPLTLKTFKHPRKKKKRKRHRPRKLANINPRDGREYPGEAFGIEKFTVVGGDSDFAQLGNGVPDMLTTDLLTEPKCEFTIVEYRKRDAILDEMRLGRSEYVDPATRVEEGHLIDPEILIRGRVEDRPGTPRRLALIAWLVDAKTGARLSQDVSAVGLHNEFFGAQKRLSELVVRDLICARRKPPPAPTPEPPAPTPPGPAPAANGYTGTFSGNADSEGGGTVHWTWTGRVHLDAAQDNPFLLPPNGAPPGSYRQFTVTTGDVDMTVTGTDLDGCTIQGSGHFDVLPGLLNTLTLQLDVPNPAYALQLMGLASEVVQVTRSGGPACAGPPGNFPIFTVWASTGATAHTSPSLTLVDSQAELTPATPFDYDYTTRWNLAPG